MGRAAGRADRQLGALRAASSEGCSTDHSRPSSSASGRPRCTGVCAWSASRITRVAVEEVVEAAGRLDQFAEAVVGLGDRLDARLRPVAVRVVVVVGQREEQEVEAVGLDQLRRAAGRVAVAVARDRGRLAGHLAAGVEVAVEELGRAPGVVAELEPGRRRPRGAAAPRARPGGGGGRGRSGTACRRCAGRRRRAARRAVSIPGLRWARFML